jgi:hypothetical protein
MKLFYIFSLVALLSCQKAEQPQTISLFNGKDLSGWHIDVPAMDSTDVESPFSVRDGLLVSAGVPGGHIITDSVFQNYRLEVEYRWANEPGNCGVLLHTSTLRALEKMFPRSIEVQMYHGDAGDFWCIVDEIEVDDMATRAGKGEDSGRRINLTDGSENPVGDWNSFIIEAVERSVRVWLNGDLVNDGFNATADHGQIALQSEDAMVEFRKLELTPINELTPID